VVGKSMRKNEEYNEVLQRWRRGKREREREREREEKERKKKKGKRKQRVLTLDVLTECHAMFISDW
jgi:hypothetical protein